MQILKKCIYPLKMYPHSHMDNGEHETKIYLFGRKGSGWLLPIPTSPRYYS